jgi:hypothetical protein
MEAFNQKCLYIDEPILTAITSPIRRHMQVGCKELRFAAYGCLSLVSSRHERNERTTTYSAAEGNPDDCSGVDTTFMKGISLDITQRQPQRCCSPESNLRWMQILLQNYDY